MIDGNHLIYNPGNPTKTDWKTQTMKTWIPLLCALAGLLQAQDSHLTLAGAWEKGACQAASARNDSLLYAGNGHFIELVDVRDWSVLQRFSTPSFIQSLLFEDGRLLLWQEDSLITYDAALPGSLDRLAAWPEPCSNSGLADLEGSLFSAIHEDTLRVWDMSDPGAPDLLSTTLLQQASTRILGQDSLLCVLHDNSLDLWSLADPASPALLGEVPGLATYPAIARDGDRLLVESEDSLKIYDLADPENPQLEGAFELPGFVIHSCLSGNRAAVSTPYTQYLYSLIDPTAPGLVDSLDQPSGGLLHFVGNRLCLVYQTKQQSWRTSLQDGLVEPATRWMGGNAAGLHLAGDRAFAGFNQAGFAILSLIAPGELSELFERQDPETGVRALDGWSTRLVTIDGNARFRLLDASGPGVPVELGAMDLPAVPELFVDGINAWCMDDDSLRMIRLLGPFAPSQAVVLPHGLSGSFQYPTSLFGDSGRLILTSSGFPDELLSLYDTSDPANPQFLGDWIVPNEVGHLFRGDLEGSMGVLLGTSGILLFEWDEGAPQTRALIDVSVGDLPDCARLDGERLWLGSYSGLRLYSIADPEEPILAGYWPTPGSLVNLEVQADRVVGLGPTGLYHWGRIDTDLDLAIAPVLSPQATIELSWNPLSFASGYAIYSRSPLEGAWIARALVIQDHWMETPFGSAPAKREYRVVPLAQAPNEMQHTNSRTRSAR